MAPLQTNQLPSAPSSGDVFRQRTSQRQRVSTAIISRLLPFRNTGVDDTHQRRRHGLRGLSADMRAQAEQIAAAFPAVPLEIILADLAVTRVPEVTVENILSGRVMATESRSPNESINTNDVHREEIHDASSQVTYSRAIPVCLLSLNS